MDTWEYIRDVRQKVTLSSRGRTELRKGESAELPFGGPTSKPANHMCRSRGFKPGHPPHRLVISRPGYARTACAWEGLRDALPGRANKRDNQQTREAPTSHTKLGSRVAASAKRASSYGDIYHFRYAVPLRDAPQIPRQSQFGPMHGAGFPLAG
ncbi:hypothetical protein GX48_02888 [Paracoccidioides brasiliensis]|nr:hypothetical protein GX48_02888 [Paracoccidioides brasiliensis]